MRSGRVFQPFANLGLRRDGCVLVHRRTQAEPEHRVRRRKPVRQIDEIVVESRVINDMKSHLSEDEFWRVIEHLFYVGMKKEKIKPPFGKRLPRKWSPEKHYTSRNANKTGGR